MKKSVLLLGVLFLNIQAFACDDALKSFPRDCSLQDRFVAIKSAFAAKAVDIDEVAEYRVIRFVDRGNWERAKSAQIKPDYIYEPAPATWTVWDLGMREVMRIGGAKGQLNNGFVLDEANIAYINKVLLMNEAQNLNIKDKITDKSLNPGEYRKTTSNGVGFRPGGKDYSSQIARSEESMDRFQARWESRMGATFSDLLSQSGAEGFGASLRSGMSENAEHTFVSYAPSSNVPKTMGWIKNFIRINLDKYHAGNPVLSPMELAAIVQKWFVSVHPFSDGNGRTSRAIQDIILANFELPYVPGGDLQDDATSVWEDYLERSYGKTESLLSALELCLTVNAPAFHCQTVDKLNAMAVPTKAQEFRRAIKKD